jgi:hypothetical protein
MPLPAKPWMPAPYDLPDMAALKALRDGRATPEQQQRALSWIVECAARTYVDPFDIESERVTAYAAGMAHVGRQIVTLLNMRTEPSWEQGR